MAFRIQKDANLDYLQANNVVSSGTNKQIIYFNSGGTATDQYYIGAYGASTALSDNEFVVPVSGTFTRLFVHKTGGNPSDSNFFTIFVNGSPITNTEVLTGATVSGELSFLSPTTVDYAAGDRINVRLTITNGADPLLALSLI